MQLYIYSCQDLIIKSTVFDYLKAGSFYCLEIDKQEMFEVYSTTSNGSIILNCDILHQQAHEQINFHQLNNNMMLCEIKPFVGVEGAIRYKVDEGCVKLIQRKNNTYIYFNEKYYGCIGQKCDIKFEKFDNGKCGVLYLTGEKKYIIIFNQSLLLCEQFVDNEVLKDCIQLYTHQPNIFNIGNLIKYEFKDSKLSIKSVCDRGIEHKQVNSEFSIIYFLEAIKCKRYKYAYNKLSYELKSEITKQTLQDYFGEIDNFKYLSNEDAYITFKHNKIMGVYHFNIKDNMIDNIY